MESNKSMNNKNTQLSPTDTACLSKIQKLEGVISGQPIAIDPIEVKSKLATFMLAHADKVMDTVAPLEQLREEVVNAFVEKTMDMTENEEVTAGQLAHAIDAIQQMNMYAVNTAKAVLDAEKISTNIVINSTTNTVNQTQHNSLNLDNALSRAKVTKAVAALTQLLNKQDTVIQGGEQDDNED